MRHPEEETAGSSPGSGGNLDHLSGIVKGAAINLLGSMGGKVLTLAYTIVLARVLDAAQVGLYFLGLTVFQMASSLSLFGLDSGMLRYVPILRSRDDISQMKGVVRLGIMVSAVLGLAMMMPLILGRHWLAAVVFHKPALPSVILGFAPAIPVFVTGAVMLAATQALGQMQYRVYVRHLTEPLLRFGLTLGFVSIGLYLWGAVFSYTLSTAVGLLLATWFLARRLWTFPEPAKWPLDWRQILFFSLPESFSKFLILLILWTDTLMLGALGTSQQVGLYSVASRTAVLAILIVDAFSIMFGSQISGMFERGAMKELDTAFKSVTKWSFSLGWPMLVLFLVLPRQVLSVFRPEDQAAWLCLVFLAVGQAVSTFTGPVGYLIIMSGRSWLGLANSLAIAALNVGLNLWLIPLYGIQGAAVASMISVILLKLIRLGQVWWLLRLQPYRWSSLKPLIAGAVAGGVAWAVARFLGPLPAHGGLIAAGGALLLVYFGLLVWMGFDEDDRFILDKVRSKLGGRRG